MARPASAPREVATTAVTEHTDVTLPNIDVPQSGAPDHPGMADLTLPHFAPLDNLPPATDGHVDVSLPTEHFPDFFIDPA